MVDPTPAAPQEPPKAPAAPAAPEPPKQPAAPAAPAEPLAKPAEPPAAKPGEPAPNAKEEPPKPPAEPTKLELKLPEGSLLDAAHLEKTVAFAKERGLSTEQAQAIVERDHANLAAFVESQKTQLSQQGERWLTEAKADKEVGGDAFPKNVELARRVVEKFGNDSLKRALDDSLLGNNPEVVRFLTRIGKAMSEDQFVRAPASAGSSVKKAPEEVLYGDQKSKEK